jgi:hypothetical protein
MIMRMNVLLTAGVCLAFSFGIGAANAQPRTSITLTLPHTVTAGTTTLPAGEFTLTPLEDNGRETLFLLQSGTRSGLFLQLARAVELDNPQSTPTEVVMRRVGDTFEIQSILISGKGYRFLREFAKVAAPPTL